MAAPDPDGEPAPLSVWTTAQKPSQHQRKGRYLPEAVRHPARMLPAIAAHTVAAYTEPGDLVLDPMAGIGTTLVEAVHLGRDAVGVEYEPHWVRLAEGNLAMTAHQGAPGTGRILCGDAIRLESLLPQRLRGQVALVLTSPPYGATVHGQVRTDPGFGIHKRDNQYSYTADRGNLAHVGWQHLVTGFTDILTSCAQYLRPGGYLAVTARPWRKTMELADLPAAVIDAGRTAGLQPAERCVALLTALRGGKQVSRASFFQLLVIRRARAAGIPLSLIAHEDVLIFRAGLERHR